MIEVARLTVAVPGFTLNKIDLSLNSQEFFAVIGPTGSGKSLLLEAMAGLVPIRQGRITIAGDDVTGMPPETRGIGLVYQDYSLFPHMTVRANLLYGVRYQRLDRRTARQRLEKLAGRLGLTRLLQRYPARLSGGEKQRVSLGRVLMLNPRAVLLDEPLSSLDPVFQDDIKELLKELHAEWQIPFIIVSHDFSDVLYLADRGAVINGGAVIQQGDIEDLFERPASDFVARFVGMKNVFSCRIREGQAWVGDLAFRLPAADRNGHGRLGIRPESIHLVSRPQAACENTLTGEISRISAHGFFSAVRINCGEINLEAVWPRETVSTCQLAAGVGVTLGIPAERLHTF